MTSTQPEVRDSVNYDDGRTSANSVSVSIDGAANDGNLSFDGGLENVGSAASGMEGIVGSPGNDMIVGNATRNTIYARQGEDVIDGGDGNDTIFGGDEGDRITGGPGNDSVHGDFDQWGLGDNGGTGDGDDRFFLRDTGTDEDTVYQCGGGNDTGEIDDASKDNKLLPIPADCEGVNRFVHAPPVVAPSGGTLKVSGDAFLGRTLTAAASFNGTDVAVTYVWSRCVDAAGTNCAGFFTGATFAVSEGDVGSRIRVVATGTNAGGTATAERLTGIVGRPPAAACERLKDQPQGDPDGDGLRNFYECGSVALDGQSMDLAALGANPLHKDMFIEIDRKAGIPFSPTAITTMMQTFDKAPVNNPDGRTGISLHVDHGPNSVTGLGTFATWGTASRSSDSLSIGQRLGTGTSVYDWTAFDTLKAANFERVRNFAFRYVIVTERYGDTNSSGIARANDWKTDNLGQDLIVALGPSGGSPTQQTGTLMHEYGHTLGLGHGGRDMGGNPDHENHKPNYPSVMSYNWQMGGVAKKDGSFVYDYSRFGRPEFQVIDETKLIEKTGIDASGAGSTFRGMYSCMPPAGGVLQKRVFDYDTGADFDCSGGVDAKASQRSMDISFGALSGETSRTTTLEPRDDWDAIVFTGGSIGGGGVGVGELGIDTIQLDGSTIEQQPAKMPNPDVHADVATLMASAQVAAGDAKKPTLKLSWKKPAKAQKPKKGKAAAVKTLPVTVILADNKAAGQLSVQAAPQIVTAKKRAKSVKLVVKLAKGKSTLVINGFDWIGNAVTLKRTFVVTCPKSGACTAR